MDVPRTYRTQVRDLVASVRASGVTDERVLSAIRRVPRHEFVESGLQARAYEDVALPLGTGAVTISQPSVVARMTEWLGLWPDARVMEVGTGSGYQAAVLCELGARVFSVERHADVLARAVTKLEALGYRVRTRHGDGTYGWPGLPPFDAIVVTAGGPAVPSELVEQLRAPADGKPDARMVIPVGPHGRQELVGLTRTAAGLVEARLGAVTFIPLVRGG